MAHQPLHAAAGPDGAQQDPVRGQLLEKRLRHGRQGGMHDDAVVRAAFGMAARAILMKECDVFEAERLRPLARLPVQGAIPLQRGDTRPSRASSALQ